MISTFLSVVEQVAILAFILIIGIVAGKYKVISERNEKHYADLIISVIVPFYLLSSFNLEFDKALIKDFFIVLICANIIVFGIWFLCSKLIKNTEVPKKAITFSMMFRNYGYYSMPLIQALFGTEGLFYCCAIAVNFNILAFTAGVYLMGNDTSFSIKKLLLQPSIIAILLGLTLFVFNIRLPKTITTTVNMIGQCNAPIGLIMVGARLSRINIKELLDFKKTGIYDIVNLLIAPIVVAIILRVCRIQYTAAMVVILWLCAPAANYTSVFAIKYGHDENFCAKIVSEQSVLCMFTIPVVITAAEAILKFGL